MMLRREEGRGDDEAMIEDITRQCYTDEFEGGALGLWCRFHNDNEMIDLLSHRSRSSMGFCIVVRRVLFEASYLFRTRT